MWQHPYNSDDNRVILLDLILMPKCVLLRNVHTSMHWCPGHLFSAHHTHCKKTHSHPRKHVCATVQKLLHHETHIDSSWNLKFCSDRRQTKNIRLNHDAFKLTEPNVQRRACWFDTQTDCTASARKRIQPPLFVNVSYHPAQETVRIHASPWRSCSCVVTLA